MQRDDMIIVSVDDHVVEPPNMFDAHLPAKYADIAPKLIRKDDGTDVWRFQTIEVPNIGLNAVAGRPKEEYGIDPTSFEEIRSGCYNVADRVMDMNANGTLGSLNFPSLPGFAGRLFATLEDKDTAKVLAQAYNDWHIDEWCGYAPERFIPLAIPMIWDPEALADEVRRVAKKGCHAITFPENPEPLNLPSLHSDHWDPFWQACSDEGTIVCMHIGSSGKLVMTSVDAPIDVLITLQPMNIVQCAADLIHSPVFRKFPDVTVALSEGGIGWIPYFLERLDHSYRTHKAWTGADFGTQMPSEVFMEHVVLCYINDGVGVKLARDIGIDRITVEIDYPHSDANWPTAPERMMEEFGATDLTDAEINAMTHENAMRFFQYDPFAIRARERCTVGALRAEADGWDVEPHSTAVLEHEARTGPVKITDLSPTASRGADMPGVGGKVVYDPYAYATHEDPYPIYASLRDDVPAYVDEARGFWALSRYDDVRLAIDDWHTYSSTGGITLERGADEVQPMLIEMDPPRHTELRALVSRSFTPKRVADLEAPTRAKAAALLDGAGTTFDAIQDFAALLPMAVISTMLGIPDADQDEVRGWSDAMLHREAGDADLTPEGLAGATQLYDYLHHLVEARRAHPSDDMTSALVSASDDARSLSHNEVMGFLFLLVIAGNETTTKLIGNALYWLWKFPDQRARLLADPGAIVGAVEEVLRFDTSTQSLARLLTRDVELHGVTLPAGMKGLLLFGSANRDPRRWERADELDIGRNPAGHVAFGHGIHHCLGAALARLETRVALEEILPRLGRYDIDEAASARVHSGNVRGFANLPIHGARP